MTERHPAWTAVSEMEGDVADVARWGDVLIGLGTSENDVSVEALSVIGWTLKRLGQRLDDRWKAAFVLAGGKG